jgi:hypothetical protein
MRVSALEAKAPPPRGHHLLRHAAFACNAAQLLQHIARLGVHRLRRVSTSQAAKDARTLQQGHTLITA